MDPTAIGWRPDSIAPEGGRVDVRWLGTAGFEIRCQDHVLLIDPYLTRASLGQCVTRALRSDEAVVRRHAPRADAIILGHTHFDHALDVPAIAKLTGARVFGSASASALCRGHGVDPSRIEVVERAASSAPVEHEVGPFFLRFHPSAHARLLLGRVPFAGEITDCEDVPLRMGQYRCGAVFGVEIRVAGRTLFHLGSAELVDSLHGLEVDLLLLTVAGWTRGVSVPQRVMRALSPAAVLLVHWDNFFSPLERGARLLPAMQMGRLVDQLQAASKDVEVGTVEMLGEVMV